MISALEHLEALSGERDQERATIDSLQSQVKHLELEDSKKLEERQRNAKELEQVEEHYKQETRDLLSTIKKLQDENRKLASSLAAATERDSAFSEDGKAPSCHIVFSPALFLKAGKLQGFLMSGCGCVLECFGA